MKTSPSSALKKEKKKKENRQRNSRSTARTCEIPEPKPRALTNLAIRLYYSHQQNSNVIQEPHRIKRYDSRNLLYTWYIGKQKLRRTICSGRHVSYPVFMRIRLSLIQPRLAEHSGLPSFTYTASRIFCAQLPGIISAEAGTINCSC